MAASRNGSEAHPFHLHGHHFWVLATGNGTWDPTTSPAQYNTVNPPFRDTLTVLKGGWAALRFVVRCSLHVSQWHGRVPTRPMQTGLSNALKRGHLRAAFNNFQTVTISVRVSSILLQSNLMRCPEPVQHGCVLCELLKVQWGGVQSDNPGVWVRITPTDWSSRHG